MCENDFYIFISSDLDLWPFDLKFAPPPSYCVIIIIIIMTQSVQPSLPLLRSFARRVGPKLSAEPRSLLHPCHGRSGGSRWSTVGHRCVSTPVKAAHHPSTWCRFVGSGLLVHRVKVWRRAQRDPVFACEGCTRRQTDRYDAGLHRQIRSHAICCAGCVIGTVHGMNPVYSSRLVWGSRSQSHRVVWVTSTCSICGPSWWYWACSDSRHSGVFKDECNKINNLRQLTLSNCSLHVIPLNWQSQKTTGVITV